MAALREILAKFGFEVDSKNLKKAEKDTESFAKKVVTAFAAAEIIGGIRNFVSEMMAVEGQITDTSDALGISRDAFQEWTYVASRGGASAEDMATAFKILQKNAADGSKAFKDLGVDVKGVDGATKETSALMGEVATALASVQDPAERTKLALEVLGKGGSKLNAIFAKGPQEIEALRKRFQELGGGLSEDALDGIGAAADALDDVELASKSLKGNLFLVLAPALRFITNAFAGAVAWFNKGENASTRLKSALVVLGAAGAAAGLAMLKPYLPFLLTIAAIYLVVQDFWTFLNGGESATGKLIEWLFGKEAPDKVRGWVKGVTDEVIAFNDEMNRSGRVTIPDKIEGFFLQLREAVGLSTQSIKENGGSWDDWAIQVGDALDVGTTNLLPFAKKGGEMLVNEVFKPIADLNNRIIDEITSWGPAIAEAAKTLGKAITDGVVEGFTGGVKTMSDKGAEGMAKMIAGMRGPGGADAHSPSRKTMLLGFDMAEGPIQALMQSIPRIERAGARYAAAGIPVTNNTRTINVQQSNSMRFDVSGGAGGQVLAMRSSMVSALDDERGALAAALRGA